MNAEQQLKDLMAEFRYLKTEEEKVAFDGRMSQALAAMNPKERKAFQKAFLGSIRRSISEAKEIKREIEMRQMLSGVESYLSLSQIAQDYFGKSRSWLYQRINGALINGNPAQFTPDEQQQLSNALLDISNRIKGTDLKLKMIVLTTKFTVMKKIFDYGVWVLAVFAFVFILWLKIDFPKIPIYFLTKNKADAINDIVLNLSYGYFSGVIVYSLTAFIPQLKKRRSIMKSMSFITFNFAKEVVREFLVLYWKYKEDECKSIYEFAYKLGEEYKFSISLGRTQMPEDTATNDPVYRDKLKKISESRNEFSKMIGAYVDYLDDKQMEAFNKVTLCQFEKDIKEPYEDGVVGLDVILDKLRNDPETLYKNGFSLYKEYVMNVLKLNDCTVSKE